MPGCALPRPADHTTLLPTPPATAALRAFVSCPVSRALASVPCSCCSPAQRPSYVSSPRLLVAADSSRGAARPRQHTAARRQHGRRQQRRGCRHVWCGRANDRARRGGLTRRTGSLFGPEHRRLHRNKGCPVCPVQGVAASVVVAAENESKRCKWVNEDLWNFPAHHPRL